MGFHMLFLQELLGHHRLSEAVRPSVCSDLQEKGYLNSVPNIYIWKYYAMEHIPMMI